MTSGWSIWKGGTYFLSENLGVGIKFQTKIKNLVDYFRGLLNFDPLF